MIEIQPQDWTTYDVEHEFHVRSPENWDGWLVLENPDYSDTLYTAKGTITKTIKPYDEFPETQTSYEVALLPKNTQDAAADVVHVAVDDSTKTGDGLV